MSCPPLALFCIAALARHPDNIPRHIPDIPATPALLDAIRDIDDPAFYATLAQLIQPLPPHLREHDISLAHPALARLQRIPDAPDFSLVTLLSLPNCNLLHDRDVAQFVSLHRLVALDLRGCPISSQAILELARPRLTPSRLRILSLHGCPNVDVDALVPLHRFPLLSAIDLRFTRCSSAAVTAHLASLGFRPSTLSSLFHPAPLALALSALEKLASTASIDLYSCPPHAIFRLHIDQLAPLPPASSPSPNTVSSFYQNAPKRTKTLLPLSAQAVQSSHATSDPLAISRPPPPWNALESYTPPLPPRRTDRSLDNPLKVDPARLHNRTSDPIADMAHHFSRKRPKIESEFAKARTNVPVKPPNPFARPVFSNTSVPSSNDAQLPRCRSLPSKPPTTSKPLRPITTFKPPILPKELLPQPLKPASSLKQTRLPFDQK